MKNIFFITMLMGLVIGHKMAFAQKRDIKYYLKTHLINIDTNYDDDNLNDLSPLINTLKNKNVIALGEATHGTYDFQAIKFRFFRFLVKQMGFRLFGIEADFTACRLINSYILTGTGDAKTAIMALHSWPWETNEMLKMVEWMKNYNKNLPDDRKLQFYGFDMQLDKYPERVIAGKLVKFDSLAFATRFSDILKINILDKKTGYFTRYPAKNIAKIDSLLNSVRCYIQSNREKMVKLFSKQDVLYLERDVVLLGQFLREGQAINEGRGNLTQANETRDRFMADNIHWILNFGAAGSRMLVWAHNRHINIDNGQFSSLGTFLKKNYQDKYYSIGFIFNEGSFNAYDSKSSSVKKFSIAQACDGSAGAVMKTAKVPVFFLNLDSISTTDQKAERWFGKRVLQRNIGAGFDPSLSPARYYFKDQLNKLYDGIIYVDKMTAAKPLFTSGTR